MKRAVFILLSILSLCSCEQNSLVKNIDHIPDQLVVKDYATAIFEANPYAIKDSLDHWAEIFPVFINGDYKNTTKIERLQDYLQNQLNQILYKNYNDSKSSFKEPLEELNNGFKYFKYYFPNDSVFPVYLYISSLNYERPIIPTEIGTIVAADLFLGQHFEEYKKQQIPLFISHSFEPEYIAPIVLREYIKSKFNAFLGGENMLEQMIALGKVEYTLNALLPEMSDSTRFQFTKQQMEWCYEREGVFWKHITTSQLLFSKDFHEFKKYLEPRPFVSSLERDSPGRAGVYIGYKIVQNYMKENPNITLQELITETDFNLIFKKSKYNP